MSELQLALIGAAVLAVVGVWAYNQWQERKYRKLATALFRGGQDDVLVGGNTGAASASTVIDSVVPSERQEPGFRTQDSGDFSVPNDEVIDSYDSTVERTVDAAQADHLPLHATSPTLSSDSEDTVKSAQVTETVAALPGSLPADTIDEMCQCSVQISVSQPLSAAGVWAVQSTWSSAISKPVTWLARNESSEPWIRVDAASNARYGHWLVAVQLVDRRGAISEADLSRYYDGVAEFGRQVGSMPDMPPLSVMLQRAQQLDQFCAQVDVQFSLSIIHAQGGSFPGTKLRGMCEAAGLDLGVDGRYHARNAVGDTEFTLANLGAEGFEVQSLSSLATNGVVLTIDVPCVTDGVVAFNRMSVTARQMANGLGGVLVDAQRTPLSDAMIVAIRSKIDEIQQVMRSADIVAGGLRARRLFS